MYLGRVVDFEGRNGRNIYFLKVLMDCPKMFLYSSKNAYARISWGMPNSDDSLAMYIGKIFKWDGMDRVHIDIIATLKPNMNASSPMWFKSGLLLARFNSGLDEAPLKDAPTFRYFLWIDSSGRLFLEPFHIDQLGTQFKMKFGGF